MRAFREFFRMTIIGGILFLLPIVVLLLVLSQAMNLATTVAEPIVTRLPEFALMGIGMKLIVPVFLLVAFAFLAGLLARTAIGRRASKRLEEALLGGLPQYQVLKNMAANFVKMKDDESLSVVLVRVEDGWQLAYLLEQINDGWVAVFLPDSPAPLSGSVLYLPSASVRPLDISLTEAMMVLRRMGAGSRKALQSVDLTVPS
jgi:uncharacterized membrane protein